MAARKEEPNSEYAWYMPKSRWKDVGGERFGKLVAVRPTGRKEFGQHTWECRCDCGRMKTVPIGSLHHRKGGTKSCGCDLYDNSKFITHGMTNHKMYNRWRNIHRRCYDPKTKGYKYYGAKGIKVCERWHDFALFYEDMGDPPFANAEIDRIDADKDYSPDNCRWLSKRENVLRANSRRRTE